MNQNAAAKRCLTLSEAYEVIFGRTVPELSGRGAAEERLERRRRMVGVQERDADEAGGSRRLAVLGFR